MRTFLAFMLVVIAGCQPAAETPERICTMEFRTVGLTVVDSTGAAVDSAEVDVIREATGRSIVCTREDEEGCVRPGASGTVQGAGSYEVVTDAVQVAEPSEAFRVVARRGSTEAEALLTIGFDGCHIEKVAGPDTLRLRF